MMIEFLTSAVHPRGYPQALQKEFVFVGRSNVGKSSLLNAVFKRKIAKVSSAPGKTRLLNFFKDERTLLVDVPGYGYAKVSKAEKESWQAMLEAYFASRRPIDCVFVLIDGRHAESELDQQMVDYLRAMRLPFVIVLTKWDCLNQMEKNAQTRYFEARFADHPIISASAKTNHGISDIWNILASRPAHAGIRPR